MKIVHIIPHFYPYIGGMELRVKELTEKLSKRHNVEIFTSNIDCPKNKQLKSTKNLKIHYLASKEYFSTPIIPKLYGELMKIPKDSIMHVHIAQAYIPEIIYKVWKKRKIPYIAHIRLDVMPSSFLGKIILNPYKKFILKRVLKKSKKIIVLTEDYRNLINKKYGIKKEKIVVIPNGNSFKIVSIKKKKSNKIKLLFVGRISSQKNMPLLLSSFKKTLLNNKNIVLNIVGEGDEKEFVKKFIEVNKLEENIFLKGRMEGNKLEEIYQNADIFISPTKQESFGTVYLEAMASGLPIITSNVPAVRNVVKNNYNGLLCNQNIKSFSKAIQKLIDNPKLRERLAKNGLKEVKKYSWDKVVEQTEQVYKEVLAENETQSKK